MNKFSNITEYTVTQLNNSIQNIIEDSFKIISVSGEISQIKKHSSGHIYFTLKDEDSAISSICWRSNVARLNVKLEEGLFVKIKGKITTYSPQSKYQLIAEQAEYQGEGALLKILEDRKKKMANEGLFDVCHKKKIPSIPSIIGVITSETGSVIKDIIHRISDRFPTEIILYPAKVQGVNCLSDLISGIDFFNHLLSSNHLQTPDVLILARGGGSLEDLMPFNEEELIRKVFASRIPIISAIGHETDVTLCDFVSDLRAPTPSAAAELAVPDRKEILLRLNDRRLSLNKIALNFLENKISSLKILNAKIPDLSFQINSQFQNLDYIEQKLINLLRGKLSETEIRFVELTKDLKMKNLDNSIKNFKEKLLNLTERIKKEIFNFTLNKKKDLANKRKELSILSYKDTLKRGFAVVRNKSRLVSDDNDLKLNDMLEIEFFKNKTLAKKIK